MKVILQIGSSKFFCDDAATAAKVADLLGQMKPVESAGYLITDDINSNGDVLFYSRGAYVHEVRIYSVDAERIHRTEAAAREFLAANEKKEA
jgi:hypothetical protein